MALMRLFLAAALLLVIFGCGKKERESREREARAQQSVATNTTERRNISSSSSEQRKEADALFNEFFDNIPTAPIREISNVDPLKNERTAPTRNFTFSPNGRYVVQISTVASFDLANKIAGRFDKLGYPAYVAQVENPTPYLLGTFFRVRIGGFDRVSEARNFGETVLRPLGYDFWVDNRSNDRVGIGGVGLGSFQPTTHHSAARPAPTPAPAPAVVSTPAPATTASFEVESGTPPNDNTWDNFEW